MSRSTKGVLIALAVIVVAILVFLPAISETTFAGGSSADGAALFKTKCAACHGADGAGATPVGKKLGIADLGSAEVQGMTDAQIAAIISGGKGKMPAYQGKLSKEEIDALVQHIRTFK